MCACAFFVAQSLLLLSFSSVALVHTDIALFYSVCGSELRYFVLLDSVVGAATVLVGVLLAWGARRTGVDYDALLALKPLVLLIVCSLALSAYLCCFTLLLRGRALELPQCVVAMKQIDDWFDPDSTERGSSLLASVALIYAILYGGLAAVLLGMFFSVCFQLCFVRGVDDD